jgi:integrase
MKPIKIGVHLDKPREEASVLVCTFSYKGSQYKYFPDISVEVSKWDKAKQRLNHRVAFAWETNDMIDEVVEVIQSVLAAQYKSSSEDVSTKQMRFLIDTERNKAKEIINSTDNLVKTFFDEWIEEKKKHHEEYYERKWRTTVNDALEVKPFLNFAEINDGFFMAYVDSLIDKENLNNTINGKVTRMKQLCREALKYGYKVNPHFANFNFPGERMAPIFLTWDEVEALESQPPKFYSDSFLFRCYTGVRFSDLKLLNKSMLSTNQGRMVIRFNIVKQRKNHLIYLPQKAYEIWERNDFDFSRGFNQKENESIKIYAQRAGLTRQVQTLRHRGSNVIVDVSPIHDIISTHMARRTFARAWYDRGGDLNKLRIYLGHADLSTTLRYIGVENDEVNNEASRLFG